MGSNWALFFQKNGRRESVEVLPPSNLMELVSIMDESFAFVAPILSSEDSYPFIVLAMERGLPFITFRVATSEHCEVSDK